MVLVVIIVASFLVLYPSNPCNVILHDVDDAMAGPEGPACAEKLDQFNYTAATR
jgi:hypothetical protein